MREQPVRAGRVRGPEERGIETCCAVRSPRLIRVSAIREEHVQRCGITGSGGEGSVTPSLGLAPARKSSSDRGKTPVTSVAPHKTGRRTP